MEKDNVLNEFYDKISSEEINLYKELAETAIKLGYKPKKDKQKIYQ
jgi:hypothetical protein